jgi:hypothetical protein
MSSLHIDHNVSSFQLCSIRRTIGSFHIFFVFVFDKGVAFGFSGTVVLDDFHILDGSVDFHFAQ